jgi:hypothetical protein
MRAYFKSILAILLLIITMAALTAGDVWAGVTCAALDIPNGSVEPPGTVEESKCVVIECNEGFKLVGPSDVCCTSSATYDPPPPTCEPLSSGCEDEQFSWKEQRLCTKYCEKLQCDEEIPHYQWFRRWLCHYYGYLFEKKTGIEPPCGCAHSPTETNGPLNPSCDPYVDCACIADPTCCTEEWNERCTCLYNCVAGQGDNCCATPSMSEQSACRASCSSSCEFAP